MPQTKEKIQRLPTISDFVFKSPLYETFSLDFEDDPEEAKRIISLFTRSPAIDGYCLWCKRSSTFRGVTWSRGPISSPESIPNELRQLVFVCSREMDHTISIVVAKTRNSAQKIGQIPSLADIAIGESYKYRKVLADDDRKELSRAVGLISHGVGVGSFVYLRRVFERLIYRVYAESGRTIGGFDGLRISEKIEALGGELPKFMLNNKNIYGFLSKGIHELNEEQCLSYYPILYESIIVILEQEQQKREDKERDVRLQAALANMSTDIRQK